VARISQNKNSVSGDERNDVYLSGKLVSAADYADTLARLKHAGALLAPAGVKVFVEEAPRYCHADLGAGTAPAVALKVTLAWRRLGEGPDADRDLAAVLH